MNELFCGDYRAVLKDVEMVDAVVCDCPYSDRTHAAAGRDPTAMTNGKTPPKTIDYARWSTDDVNAFVEFWAPKCRGWFCTITDHILARAWESELERHGRYVFSPLACVEPGSRVRLVGDGPAQWSTWLVVARPKTREFTSWGSLPGAYSFTEDRSGRLVMGGKALGLMRAIVRDYSRAGDLVCDPCAGGGTTAVACFLEGRRFVGAELDPATYAKAAKRIEDTQRQQHLFSLHSKPKQETLW